MDWQLAPFLRGLCEPAFATEVRDFITRHAEAFSEPCADGSCPLTWTELHEEYSALFERQLRAVVREEGFSLEDFKEHLAELRDFAELRAPADYLPGCEPSYIPPSSGIRVAEFWDFLEALTASTNFDSFKELMCIAAQAQAAQGPRSPDLCGYAAVPAEVVQPLQDQVTGEVSASACTPSDSRAPVPPPALPSPASAADAAASQGYREAP